MNHCHFCQKPLEDSAQECLYCGEILSAKFLSNKTFSSENEIATRIDADIKRRFGEGEIIFDGNHGIFFKKILRITKKDITFGKKTLIHKNVTALSFNIFHPMPSNTFLVQTHINLSDGKQLLKININRNNNQSSMISDDLIGALYVLVGKRIFYNMILAFDSRRGIDICGFRINHDGISHAAPYSKTVHVKWSDYCGMKYVNEKIVLIMAKGANGKVRKIGKFDLRWLNSEYLRDLMPIFYNKMISQMKAEAGHV